MGSLQKLEPQASQKPRSISRFNGLPAAPPDESFHIFNLFTQDSYLDKVNLGIGVYRADNGQPWPLPAVTRAEERLHQRADPSRHEYTSMMGDTEFLELAQNLIFGLSADETLERERIASVQTISGSGANHIGAYFLVENMRPRKVWLSDPSWINHAGIWSALGAKLGLYSYYNAAARSFDFEGMKRVLEEQAEKEDVIVLQASAHNPTGLDPTKAQWREIAEICQRKGIFPFFDCAYQGFASGDPVEDSWAVHYFLASGLEMGVAQSFSKNFGLYGQRPPTPAKVCHEPHYDEEKCKAIQDSWKAYEWYVEDPVSLMLGNWAASTCPPNPETSCRVGGYPAYIVNATTAEHAQAGINFARENNIRLVVKGTGHDFLGRSIAPGSLSIWTHHLKFVKFHKDKFTLTGSRRKIDGHAITAGAGNTVYDLYMVAAKHSTVVLGGAAKSVGIGGYITGGGHSMLASTYGLAADNVLEIEVVTPQGKILTVNEDRHADLFWALRGGGGSTFGVIISVTMSAFPSPRIQRVNVYAAISATSPASKEFLGFVLGEIPALMDAGLRGYCVVSPHGNAPYPYPSMPIELPGTPSGKTYIACVMMLLNGGPSAVDKILKPLNETIQKRFLGSGELFTDGMQSYDNWIDWFNVDYDQTQAGGSGVVNSWLLDRKTLEEDPNALVEAITAVAKPYDGTLFFPIAGKGVHHAKPRGGSNAVNPGWRKAYVHLVNIVGFDPLNKTTETEAVKALRTAFKPIRELSPNMGAYLNEASMFEEEPQKTFWGSNYQKLLRIKRSLDPHDVFWCFPCVGNERWEQKENGRLCKIRQA
ncbi:6-hydroxy-D-nicotine oxidase-like protein [Paramyrothecium foliicola]|nr:6-hydroxy-D-nicotine oxidase-like protein [Paramyrothecium foliicola]